MEKDIRFGGKCNQRPQYKGCRGNTAISASDTPIEECCDEGDILPDLAQRNYPNGRKYLIQKIRRSRQLRALHLRVLVFGERNTV